MADGGPNEQNIAGILAILMNQQAQILTEIRTSQQQVSSLDSRMVKLEGLVDGMLSGKPGSSAVASGSGSKPTATGEAVARLSSIPDPAQGGSNLASEQSGTSIPHTSTQSQANELPSSSSKGKGKEVAREELLSAISSVEQVPEIVTRDKSAVPPAQLKEDFDPESAAPRSTRLPTPASTSGGVEKPLSARSFSLSSDDMPILQSAELRTKRKRKINQPRAAPAPTLYGKERSVSVAESSIPASRASPSKRKTGAVEPRSLSSAAPSPSRKRRRVEIFIDIDAQTRERMRLARPVREVFEDLSRNSRPKSADLYADAFGSDLSDLTDIEEDEDDKDTSDAEDEVVLTDRDSENEVEGQVQMAPSSSDDTLGEPMQVDRLEGRPPRRSVTKPNYVTDYGDLAEHGLNPPIDVDSDYAPEESEERAPGPSSRPYVTRGQVSNGFGTISSGHVSMNADEMSPSTSTKRGQSSASSKTGRDHVGHLSKPRVPTQAKDKNLSLSKGKKPETKPMSASTSGSKPKDESKPLRLRSEVKKDKPEIRLVASAGIQRRLEGYESLDVGLEPNIRDVLVTRKFMSETYGGSPQPLYPTISEAKRAAMGGHQHKFVFPTLKMNPEVPLIPGAPGLLCRALSDVPWGDNEVKLVVGIGEAMWGYMGNYTTTKTDSLTKEEWDSLPEHTKRAWALDIATRDKYVSLRTRIYLRELFEREPTEVEVEDQSQIMKSQRSEPTNDQLWQIVNAYSAGHEEIHIWCFKCVGYDEDFQRELVDKFKAFVPKKQRNVAQTQEQGASAKKTRGRPRKQAAPDISEENRPQSLSKRTGSVPQKAGSSSAQGTAGEAPRELKKLPRRGAKGSKPGLLPSPPNTPPVSSSSHDQEEAYDILAHLRELWSAGRASPITDEELAGLLYERRNGIRDLMLNGQIVEAHYTAMKVFAAQLGYEWED